MKKYIIPVTVLILLIGALIFAVVKFGVKSAPGPEPTITPTPMLMPYVVERLSEKYYDANFSGKENVFLFYVAYSSKEDEEYQYIRYGSDTHSILDYTFNEFFKYYSDYYNDDVGIQLSQALAAFYNNDIYKKYEKITIAEAFDDSLIKDELGWIDSSKLLTDTARKFYDETGIQFEVAIIDYDKIAPKIVY